MKKLMKAAQLMGFANNMHGAKYIEITKTN